MIAQRWRGATSLGVNFIAATALVLSAAYCGLIAHQYLFGDSICQDENCMPELTVVLWWGLTGFQWLVLAVLAVIASPRFR